MTDGSIRRMMLAEAAGQRTAAVLQKSDDGVGVEEIARWS
jgi:hypothetical protein